MTRRLDFPVLPFERWSAQDRAAWQQAVEPPRRRRTDRPGLARHPQSRLPALRASFGRWLGFLEEAGFTPTKISGLDHLDDETLFAFSKRLHDHVSRCTVRTYLVDLEIVVQAMAPEQDRAPLHAYVRGACRRARPEGNKQSRIVAATDLLELGCGLMAHAGERNSSLGKARDFRDGLAIALLIAIPVRISNLATIEIDRHLLIKDGACWLVFSSNEVKNRRPIERRVPPGLLPCITIYLEQHRPRLLQQHGRWWHPPGEALWISDDGGALGARQLSARISARTRARFGHAVNPHLFRDCAATSIAVTDPAHVGIIMPVLGHADHRTGERFYNQASGLEASRAWLNVMEMLTSPDEGDSP